MNLKESFQLLTLASARDGRTVDREVALVWADDLKHVSLPDAVEAATMHYRESTVWMMPGHVIANVKRIRAARERDDRIRRQLEPPRPAHWDEAGIEHYWQTVQALKAEKS